jgi:26S proteasome regulatory subunit T5
MSSVQAPGGSSNGDRGDKQDGKDTKDTQNKRSDGDAEMKDAETEEDDILDDEILGLNTQDILTRRRLLENDSRIMRSEYQRLSHEKATMGEKIKENQEKIANNRYLLLILRMPWRIVRFPVRC